MKTRKILKTLGIIAAILAYAFSLMLIIRRYVEMDSDYANLVLEANDILSGNVLLSGWIQTGISFITTDLPFFVLGALFGGISAKTYYIAAGSMIAAAVLCGWLACRPEKIKRSDPLIYFSLCAFPCEFALMGLRAHTGAVIWTFLAFYFFMRLKGRETPGLWCAYFACVTFGALGDSLTLVICVVPVVLFSLVNIIFRTEEKKEISDRPAVRFICVSAAAVVLSTVLDKLFYTFGGAQKNSSGNVSFIAGQKFVPIEAWKDKILLYLKSMLMLHDTDFQGQRLANPELLKWFLCGILFLTGFILLVRYLVLFVRGKETDTVCVLVSIGFTAASASFILLDVAGDVYSSRYIAGSVIMFAFLIARTVMNPGDIDEKTDLRIRGCILAISLTALAFRLGGYIISEREYPEQKQLASYLQKHGLEYGYGGFWDASCTAVLSENKVKVRAIRIRKADEKFYQYKWFCKNEWYEEPARFVVARSDINNYGITPETVIAYFGEPVRQKQYKDWYILIYDYDLSEKLE